MKRVKIYAYQVGLVYRNKAYKRMLTAGNHWVGLFEEVVCYDMQEAFWPPYELNIYLQDKALAEALQVIEVGDREIALQYENGLLKKVLTAGRYAYWKSLTAYTFVKADISDIHIPEQIGRAALQHPLMAPYLRSFTVESYEQALLFVDGKFVRALESGVHYWFKNNIPLNVLKVDMRQLQMELNGQEILTKDKASLRLNAWALYRVTDVKTALLQNKDYERQLYVACQLALREYIAGLTLDELLEKKDVISKSILETIRVQGMGVALLGFGIRDIILPGDMKEIMNQVLVAEKKAQANLITRREETASTRSLLNTAKMMEDNPMLFRLKEMEYVEKIAEKIGSISVGGNGVLTDQLKQLFVPRK